MKRMALSLALILSLSGCASTGNASKVSDVLLLGGSIAGMIVGATISGGGWGGGAIGVLLNAIEIVEWPSSDGVNVIKEYHPDVIRQQ